jgi:hypothetical protein
MQQQEPDSIAEPRSPAPMRSLQQTCLLNRLRSQVEDLEHAHDRGAADNGLSVLQTPQDRLHLRIAKRRSCCRRERAAWS